MILRMGCDLPLFILNVFFLKLDVSALGYYLMITDLSLSEGSLTLSVSGVSSESHTHHLHLHLCLGESLY